LRVCVFCRCEGLPRLLAGRSNRSPPPSSAAAVRRSSSLTPHLPLPPIHRLRLLALSPQVPRSPQIRAQSRPQPGFKVSLSERCVVLRRTPGPVSSPPKCRSHSSLPSSGPCPPSVRRVLTDDTYTRTQIDRQTRQISPWSGCLFVKQNTPNPPHQAEATETTMTGNNLPQDAQQQQHNSSIVQPAAGKLPRPASQLVDSHNVSRR
jgi:hypothetical protein